MKTQIVHCATLMLILPIFLKIVASANVNDKIKFILSSGSGQSILNVEKPESLKPLSKFKCLKIYTHGFTGSCSNPAEFQEMSITYKKHKKDCAVVCVDWPSLAFYTPISATSFTKALTHYNEAVNNTLVVGKRVAEFLTVLKAKKVIKNLDCVHLIGLSLGAHVMGVAGHHLGGKVGRITGLDPSGPNFDTDKPLDERLDKTDGKYVDVIHTNAGHTGTALVIGHSDFFPDGGVNQNKCPVSDPKDITSGLCSHLWAFVYFVKSISNAKFCMSCKCDSFQRFEENKCDCTKKNSAPMGEASKPGTTGTYYCKPVLPN